MSKRGGFKLRDQADGEFFRTATIKSISHFSSMQDIREINSIVMKDNNYKLLGKNAELYL
jgi:hypothetical protein